jgi:hypothetical protein
MVGLRRRLGNCIIVIHLFFSVAKDTQLRDITRNVAMFLMLRRIPVHVLNSNISNLSTQFVSSVANCRLCPVGSWIFEILKKAFYHLFKRTQGSRLVFNKYGTNLMKCFRNSFC